MNTCFLCSLDCTNVMLMHGWLDDIETGFWFGFHAVCRWFECFTLVVCICLCSGRVGVGFLCVVG